MGDVSLAIPLLSSKVTTFEGIPWYLADGVRVDVIRDVDFAALHRDDLGTVCRSSIDPNTVCVYVSDPDCDDFEKFATDLAIELEFVFNNFSVDSAVVLPFAILLETGDRSHVLQVLNMDPVIDIGYYRRQTYVVRDNTQPTTVARFFELVANCCRANPTLLFALERFNSSLIRSDPHDKIVDMAISLETMLATGQEIRLRFALFISFVASGSAQGRLDAYQMLLNLYDARSAIVHGTASCKKGQAVTKKVMESWSDLVKMARAALGYHLFFIAERGRDQWDKHVLDLMFGKDTRIVD